MRVQLPPSAPAKKRMLVNDLKGTVQGRGPFTVLTFSNLISHGLAKGGKGGPVWRGGSPLGRRLYPRRGPRGGSMILGPGPSAGIVCCKAPRRPASPAMGPASAVGTLGKPGNHREGGGATRHRDAAAARHRARPSCGPAGTAGWLFQTPTDPRGSTLPTAGVFLCLVRFSAGLGRFAPRGALGAVKPLRGG